MTTMLEVPSAGVNTAEPAVEPGLTPKPASQPNDGPLAALMADAAGFDFFQAVRLLEQHLPGALDRSPVAFGHDLRLSIAPHDGLAAH